MLLSRSKPAIDGGKGSINSSTDSNPKESIYNLEDFLRNRDYTGAIALLQHTKKGETRDTQNELWMAYCHFHLAEFKTALQLYSSLIESEPIDADRPIDRLWTFVASCQFYLGMYAESKESALKSSAKHQSESKLVNRLMFHLCYKLGDESALIEYHQKLEDTIADQLCLASIHFLRSHYQEAIDVYKKILVEHRKYLALNVYIALCYYKLDYYDVSQEVLALYLQHFADSVTAVNLKACNHYRLYNGKAAEHEMRGLIESMSPSFTYAKDLIRHNLVVFRNGEAALQVLPSLVDVLPEARLNLVIYHLKHDNIDEANQLIKDLDPSVPHEYILKGVVNAAIGQSQASREHLKIAQQFYQMVGGSASECDTIPGRQCMASCFFILKQFDDVLLYLSSIKSYFYNDDTFNFNYAQAKAATNNFKEAEEAFLAIHSDHIKNDYVYTSWLARTLIMNKKPKHAWDLYLKRGDTGESFNLLQLIANDCYKMGHFLYAAKAFDALEKLDNQNPEYWEGKRGSCAGVLQMIIAQKEPKESIHEVMTLLRGASNPQSNLMINVIKNWSKENKVIL